MKKILTLVFIVYSSIGVCQQNLEKIVVSTTVEESDPSNVEVVDTILQNTDIAQTLDKTPSVISFSDYGNYKGYSYFRIRGVSQNKVAVEFDGVPLLDAEDNGLYLSNFGSILESVGQISVEKGATVSGLSSSYAGRVNLTPDKIVNNKVKVNLGSFNNKDIYVNTQANNFSIGLGISDTEGYRNPSGNTNYSSFIKYEKDKLKVVSLTGKQHNNLAWLGALESDIQENRKYNQSRGEDDKFLQNVTYLKYENKGVKLQPYFSYLHGGYDFNLGSFLYKDYDEIYRYELEHFRYGAKISYSKNIGKTFNTIESNGSLFKRKHWADFYSNVGYKNEISNTFKTSYIDKDLEVFGIVQHRAASFNYKGDKDFTKQNWNFLNFKTGVGYKNLYYNFGKVTREPTRSDLFGGEENFTELVPLNNETAYSHELGIKDKLWSTNIFYNKYDNEIALNGAIGSNSLPLNSNLSKSERYGIEYDFKFNTVFNFRTYGSFSRNTINSTTNHILSPEREFNLEVTKSLFTVSYNHVGEMYINTENTFKLPNYNTLNLNINKQFESFGVYLQLNNLTNEENRTYGNINANGDPVFIVAPKFNFTTGLEWRL